MCILQDSYEDWRREAAKMTAIYSNATVTISALDSPGSTTGFLQPRPKDGVIGRGFVIKRNRDNLDYGTNRSILSTRGWCLQERMLSPSLLHFSREQMYWECRTGVNQEIMKDEPIVYRSNFTLVRKVFGMGTSLTFRDWYHTVEEYSRRKLSYGSDKLPALAGIADRFRSVGIGGEYVAGLWAHDIERGIFWVTNWDPVERPTHARAPSWSWASLDGQVEFQLKGDFQHRHETDLSLSLFKVLQISIGVGMDDPAAPEVQGCLKIRGPVAQMRYQHNDPSDLHGSLAFENEEPIALRAVMDFDRNVSRDCWVLTAGPSDPRILLLEEIDVGTFRRIGCVKWYQDSPNRLELSAEEFSRFLVRDMVLV
ncbi:heterokaryon incompatibility protein [Colletotrichum karsti]|uniref:Heterokaryon incompatibility protein n=1 Tax=Colletotrichum karsti TaxID=1095194 RepID=A0A9P6LDY3_9PEZI|nr:heterokaryon incompatibility protein [Colletotrichum karsti]KAF9872504.1 heterokaryon incompatibility protein [Colletotrichum karsti]